MNTEYAGALKYHCDLVTPDFSVNESAITVGSNISFSKNPSNKEFLLCFKFSSKWQYNNVEIADIIYVQVVRQSGSTWKVTKASHPLFVSANLAGATCYLAIPLATSLENELPTKHEVVEIVNEISKNSTTETILDLGTHSVGTGEFEKTANPKLLTPETMM